MAHKARLDREVADFADICHLIVLGPDGFRSILQLRASRLALSRRQTQRDQETYEDLLEADAAAGRETTGAGFGTQM